MTYLLTVKGYDPNAVDASGRRALQYAVGSGQLECVETLLRFGADPSAVDLEGRAAVHVAASLGLVKIMEVLLRSGADPDMAQQGGWGAVNLCVKHGHVACLRVLLAHGASPDGVAEGCSALMLAAKCGRAEMVSLLVEMGANVELTAEYRPAERMVVQSVLEEM